MNVMESYMPMECFSTIRRSMPSMHNKVTCYAPNSMLPHLDSVSDTDMSNAYHAICLLSSRQVRADDDVLSL
jgi:hypothetical protein